jgi:hypothetical protein
MEIRKQEADSNSLHSRGFELAGDSTHRGFVQRQQHFTKWWYQPFWYHLAVSSADERPILPRDLLHNRVMLRLLVASNVNNVPIAR